MPSSASSSSSSSLQQQWAALFAATLETWCHEVLYVRRVYPRDSFATTSSFLGISKCRANRHPQVVQYIQEAVRIVVPALLSGVADECVLVILPNATGDNHVTLERYVLRLSGPVYVPTDEQEEPATDGSILHQLEAAMRQLILSVQAQEGSLIKRKLVLGDEASFKVCLRMSSRTNSAEGGPENGNQQNAGSNATELAKAVNEGMWFSPSSVASSPSVLLESSSEENKATVTEKVRPIHHSSVPSCGLSLNFLVRSSA